MSESSAEVRLQVVHPVPAFFVFQKIFLKLYSKMPLRIPISIGTSQKWKAARGILDSRSKKRVNLRRFLLLFSVHPKPNGRKVDKMLTLKKVKELVEHRCTVDCTPTCVASDCAAVCGGICT